MRGSAGAISMTTMRVLIWDNPTRVFYWTLSVGFFDAFDISH